MSEASFERTWNRKWNKKETKTMMQLGYEAVVLTMSIIRSKRKMVFCKAVAITNSCPQMFRKISTLKILKIPGNFSGRLCFKILLNTASVVT